MEQGQGELGLAISGHVDENNQDNLNNSKNVNNRGNQNNQGAPHVVPVIPARPVHAVAVPLIANLESSIRKPPPGVRFELKQSMVHILHSNGQFTGLPHEDPQIHRRTFIEITNTYIPIGVSSDYVRLTLFPYSLLGAVRHWLDSEPPNSITTWDDLAKKFPSRFFPSKKTAKLRGEIINFVQKQGEDIYQAWARFKQMLNSCPHHMKTNEVLAQTFFEGLDYNACALLNSAAGGQALSITSEEFFALLDKLSEGNQGYEGEISRTPTQKANHPNFSWGGNQNQNQVQRVNQYRSQGAGQQYYNPNQGSNPSAPKGGMTNEELLQKLMTKIGTQLNARIDNLEKQVAQVANSLNLHPQGGLLGDTEPNPKQLHAVSTRSGLQLEELAPKKRDTELSNKEKKVEEVPIPQKKLPTPFSQRLKKQNEDECFGKFLSLLKHVHINLPFVDIL
ncbi:hypothetical protein R3W88_016278 [Solanum pinnatisectum]|uniref:Retrotransposon gag domain-containing protein n=1 Tax=Solanum pinnatisectum TaxID=50273 RepID=A0AAV9KWX4_9SOLN|nr:hypothetical protein R3W88_016278 [Solanum pinnatisectum]